MNLQDWHDSGDTLTHGGNRIFYRSEGNGTPLLLIHGYPTAGWDWHEIWSPLCDEFRCVTFDMLGFGYSDKPRRAYTIGEQADIACVLMEKLGLDSCHMVSHDYGDTVAQELLARHNRGQLPFSIQSLSMLNGGLFPETHQPVLIQKLLLGPLGGLFVRLMSRRTLAKNFRKIFGPNSQPSEQELDEFWQLIAHNGGDRIMHLVITYMEERRTYRERWVGALQETDVPLRLINGLVDPISGGHMADRYEELVPSPDVVRLETIGHYPQVEAPDAVLKAIREKIESI